MPKKRAAKKAAKKKMAGKKPMQLWWTPQDFAAIEAAAKKAMRPMTQYVQAAAMLQAAKDVK